MKWIHVDDALPEEYTFVLIVVDGVTWRVATLRKGIWWDTNMWVKFHHVTHWMELPELPE